MSEESRYRPLRAEEIETLTQQGCSAEGGQWQRVQVAEGCQIGCIQHVHFGGQVQIGALGGNTRADTNKPSLIRQCQIVDCRLGDHVRIENVGVAISGYDIGHGAVIENVGLLQTRPDGRFGNGVEVEVLNEGGGREVVLFDELSSQFAHMLCLYRYEPELIQRLQTMAAEAATRAWTERGRIGAGATVRSVVELIDVHVGPHAEVVGAQSLVNGSILSAEEARTYVGPGVQAHDFIIAEGARVDGAAMLAKSYVGQGTARGSTVFGRRHSVFRQLRSLSWRGLQCVCRTLHGDAP